MTSSSVSRSSSRRVLQLGFAGLVALLAMGTWALVADDRVAPAPVSAEQIRAAADAVRRDTASRDTASRDTAFRDTARLDTVPAPVAPGAGTTGTDAVSAPASMLPPPVIDSDAVAPAPVVLAQAAVEPAPPRQRPEPEPEPESGSDGAAVIDRAAAADGDDSIPPTIAEASLSALLAGLDRFNARFTQTLQDGRGNQLRRASGELWAERPDRFRWEISAPFAELLVGDGRMLWLWDPDLEQVTVRPYDDRLRGTPALLLSGDPAELIAGFEVALVSAQGSRRVYLLTPRSGDGLFDRLEMVFVDDLPQTLVIHDGMGQRTELVFEAARADFEPEPGRFSFEIPDGADVLREEAQSAESAESAPPAVDPRP